MSNGLLGHPPRPHKPSPLDYLKALGPIGLGVLAAFQANGAYRWALLGFAFLALLVAFAAPAWQGYQRWKRRRRDDAVARRAVPELRRLVRRFIDLVDPDHNDTLTAIVQNGLQGDLPFLRRLGLPASHWHKSVLHELLDRLRDEPTGLAYLMRAVSEFYTTANAYSTQYVVAFFESLEIEDRQRLMAACGPSMESFRERYIAFRDDYEKYVRTVLSELHTIPPLSAVLPRPKPQLGLTPAVPKAP